MTHQRHHRKKASRRQRCTPTVRSYGIQRSNPNALSAPRRTPSSPEGRGRKRHASRALESRPMRAQHCAAQPSNTWNMRQQANWQGIYMYSAVHNVASPHVVELYERFVSLPSQSLHYGPHVQPAPLRREPAPAPAPPAYAGVDPHPVVLPGRRRAPAHLLRSVDADCRAPHRVDAQHPRSGHCLRHPVHGPYLFPR
jgi:hypothetical protein